MDKMSELPSNIQLIRCASNLNFKIDYSYANDDFKIYENYIYEISNNHYKVEKKHPKKYTHNVYTLSMTNSKPNIDGYINFKWHIDNFNVLEKAFTQQQAQLLPQKIILPKELTIRLDHFHNFSDCNCESYACHHFCKFLKQFEYLP